MGMVQVSRNTYPGKDALGALGGRWDAAAKAWMVPSERAEEARKLVGASKPARAANWRCPNKRDCGDPTCDGNCGY